MRWWERWRERQHQLVQGVDADLVRANHQRFRLAFGLLGCAFLLGILVPKLHLPSTLRLIVGAIVTVVFLVGFLLAAWARQEAAFLSKPDPEEPPKIFK
jgi:heme A synthase